MIFGSELLLFVTILRAFPADLRIILSIFVATDFYTFKYLFQNQNIYLGPIYAAAALFRKIYGRQK